jgi:hypothetical protein
LHDFLQSNFHFFKLFFNRFEFALSRSLKSASDNGMTIQARKNVRNMETLSDNDSQFMLGISRNDEKIEKNDNHKTYRHTHADV